MFKGAKWIWGADAETPDAYMEFVLPVLCRAEKRYRLCLSCDGDYALYLRGELIAFGQYADYPHYRVYDELELTSHMEPGENELTLLVWHSGVNCFTYVKKDPGLLFSLYEDQKQIAVSDHRVLCRTAPGYRWGRRRKITSQLGLTFFYDERIEGGALAPACQGAEAGVLFPRPVNKTRLCDRTPSLPVSAGGYVWRDPTARTAKRMQTAELHPREQDLTLRLCAAPNEDGVYAILDLGKESCGFPELELELAADGEIAVGWGEHLADGRPRVDLHGRNFTFRYYAKAGRVRYCNPFRRLGCRYLIVMIAAREAVLHYAGIRPVVYDLDMRPFDAGNELRNEIYRVSVRTLQLCMHEHYEDCPWREQSLYTLDSRNQMLCGYYAFGETRFPRGCLELISHGRRADGLLSLCYPAGIDRPIPAFSLIYPIQMNEYLCHSGDTDFAEKHYPLLTDLLQLFLARRRKNGLIPAFYQDPAHWNFYEWSPGMEGERPVGEDSFEAPLNAFLSLSLSHMSHMARVLGKDADADGYARMHRELNAAIAAVFYRPARGLFASYTDDAEGRYHVLTNSLCLLCGAAEGLDKRRLLQILAANGEGEEDVVPDTLSMTCFRYDALLGEDAARYREGILSEIDRVYSAMLQAGATSFWETARGEADFDGAGSLCHGWSALPVYYYHKLLKESRIPKVFYLR